MFRKLLDLLSDSAVYGLSTLLGQVVGFLLLPLYTRYLTPADYGVLAMLGIVSLLFGNVANLALASALFRRYYHCTSDSDRRILLGTGLLATAAASLVFLAATVALAPGIAAALIRDASRADLVIWTLLAGAATNLGQLPLLVLRARRQVRRVAALNVAKLCATILLTVWMVVALDWGVAGVVLAGLAVEAVAAAGLLAGTAADFAGGFSAAVCRSLLAYSLPLLPHRVLASAMAMVGQYSVAELIGLEQAGLFAIATRFAMPMSLAVNAVQEAWIPHKFQTHAQEADPAAVFRSTFTYYVAGVCCLWVWLSAWGPELVRWFTAPGFHTALWLVASAVLVRVAMGCYFMLGTGIEVSDDTRPFPLISLCGLTIVALGSFSLVPIWGAQAANLTTAAGWMGMAVVAYWLAQARFRIAYDWPALAATLALAAAAVGATLGWQVFAWPIRVALATLVTLIFPAIQLLVLYTSPGERPRVEQGLRVLAGLFRRRMPTAAADSPAMSHTP